MEEEGRKKIKTEEGMKGDTGQGRMEDGNEEGKNEARKERRNNQNRWGSN